LADLGNYGTCNSGSAPSAPAQSALANLDAPTLCPGLDWARDFLGRLTHKRSVKILDLCDSARKGDAPQDDPTVGAKISVPWDSTAGGTAAL